MEPREIQAAQSSPSRQDDLSPAQLGDLCSERPPGMEGPSYILRSHCQEVSPEIELPVLLPWQPISSNSVLIGEGESLLVNLQRIKPFSNSRPECG